MVPAWVFNSNTCCCMAEACVRDQKDGFAPLLWCRLHESAPRHSEVMMMSSKPYLIFFGGGFRGGSGEKGYLNKHPEYPPCPTIPYLMVRQHAQKYQNIMAIIHSILLPWLYLATTIQYIYFVFSITTDRIILLLVNLLLCNSVSLALAYADPVTTSIPGLPTMHCAAQPA